jgi:diaminopimelate decarboxylase/acyl carrier protein
MEQKIIQQVKQALVKTLTLSCADHITMQTRLKEDLGLDSMSSLTFLMALEDSIDGFLVNPDTLDLTDLIDVGSISDYINKEISTLHAE